MDNDFIKFAHFNNNIPSLTIHDYMKSFDVIDPYILEERKLNAVPMSVFSRLLSERIIWLGTEINDDVANIVQAQLLYLSSNIKGNENINLYINSPGGEVYAGLGIIDTMEMISSDVSTTCTALAASMAAVILSCGTKGKRKALRHSRILLHQVMGGAYGQASDIEIQAKEILDLKKELIDILAEKTGKSIKKLTNDTDRDFWLKADDAVKYGVIDEVIKK